MKAADTKSRRPLIIAAVVLAVVAAGMMSLLLTYKIKTAVYEERRESLHQIINLAARSINDNISVQWEIAHVYENDVKTHLEDYSSPDEYLRYFNSQLADKEDRYFLVDSLGKYYCSDGVNGKIISTDYFLDDTPDELECLDTLPHLDGDQIYLIFRTRLDKPITVSNENGDTVITYCCLMHDVSKLDQSIADLFSGNNNTIVFDTDTGVMLYKQFGISLLVDGYNVYDKYRRVSLEYADDSESVIADIKDRNETVTLMNLNGEEYYLCSSPLEVSNWSILLVVSGTYFNSSSGYAFTGIIITIAVIMAIVAVLVIALYWYFTSLRINRKTLEGELRLNEALNEAYKTKSTFLSYMSHDIRTPINGIIGMSNIGIAGSSDKEKVEDCFKKIAVSGKHLLAIVNDVLDMSAIESGKVVISSERMNIKDTLSECIDIIKGSLDSRNLTVTEEYDCRDMEVLGDEFHLKQIVINILSNAVKFTGDGGSIKVCCRQLDGQNGLNEYEIAISDTGIGMSEEFQKHVFEAFRTATPDGKTRFKGSGLGMAISSEYARLMNGTISVSSEPGKGSTFTIVLPFTKADTEEEEEEEEEEERALRIKKLNVLVAEDNDINLEITCDMLEGMVNSIHIARNGKEALDMFSSGRPYEYDIILMDVMMPEMNGLECTAAIRSSGREDSNIRIVALTANTYKDDIDAVFTSGMDDYLNKPFSAEQLIEKIKRG